MTKYLLLIISVCLLIELQAQVEPYRPFTVKEQSVLLSTGVRLRYVEQGDPKGIPIVLLHGYTDSWHSFETVLPHLSKTYHVFVLTMRGHGNSDKPASEYSPEEFAADIAAFVRDRRIDPVVVAGHSMGGIVAQQFTLDYPELVKGLLIIGSDASFKDNPGIPEFRDEINKLGDEVEYEFADAFQRSTCALPIDSNFYRLLVRETMKLPVYVWKSVMNSLMNSDLTNRLHEIAVPVMILWGDKDGFCRREDQQKMMTNLSNAELVIYNDTGHAMHWERPRKFAADLDSFIRKHINHQP